MKTCKDCAHHRACAMWHADQHYDLNHSLAEIADNAACEEFVATWISVDDELPDCFCGGYNDCVLVCTIDGTVDTAWCRNGSWFPTSRERDANDTFAVKHWMPLPEPPKERREQ